MINVTANENAKKEFIIPVSWKVCDEITVKANSLEEAYYYVNSHSEDIPLGKEPEYVEDSYRVSESVENCIPYQQDILVCTSFDCEDLSEYTDSMLFDSGTTIAEGTFLYKGEELSITLKVSGYVSVNFMGETFKYPSEFPEELKQIVRDGKLFDDPDKVYVWDNNWFEYIYDSDGVVEEEDLCQMTPEQVLDTMTEIAEQYFQIDNKAA